MDKDDIDCSIDYMIQIGKKLWVLIENNEILILNGSEFNIEHRIKTKSIVEFLQSTTEFVWCIFQKTIQIYDPTVRNNKNSI